MTVSSSAPKPAYHLSDMESSREVLERQYFLGLMILEFLLFLYLAYPHYDHPYAFSGIALSLGLIIFLIHPRRWGLEEWKFRMLLSLAPAPFILLLQGFFLAYFNDPENISLLVPVMLITATTLYFGKPHVQKGRGDVAMFLFSLYLISLLMTYIHFFRGEPLEFSKGEYISAFRWYIVSLFTAIIPYAYLYSHLKPSKSAILCLFLSILFSIMTMDFLGRLSYFISLDDIPGYYYMAENLVIFFVNPAVAYAISARYEKLEKVRR